MSNWKSITIDDLKAVGSGIIVDKARSTATGAIDPAQEAIAGAVSQVRATISTANALDADATKVPNSLAKLTARLAIYTLMRRLRLPLSDDEKKDESEQENRLTRYAEKNTKVETPDNPACSAEMQVRGAEFAQKPVRERSSREQMRGL